MGSFDSSPNYKRATSRFEGKKENSPVSLKFNFSFLERHIINLDFCCVYLVFTSVCICLVGLGVCGFGLLFKYKS